MKLSVKLLLLFLALSILPLAMVSALSFYNAQRAIEQDTIERLTSTTVLKEAEFDLWVRRNEQTLQALAERPLVRDYAASLVALTPDDAAYQTFYATLLADHLTPLAEQQGGYLVLSILRASDGLVLVSTDERLEGKFRESEPYFLEGKRGTYVDNVRYFLGDDGLAMHISTPIVDREGELVGVLVGHVDLDEMSHIMAQGREISNSEETYLVNTFNYFVTESRFVPDTALRYTVYSDGVTDCLAGNNGVGLYDDYRGVPVIGAYRWMAERELCILTEEDQAEAFAPIGDLRRSVIGIGLGVTIGVALLGVLFARTIIEPVERLVDGTEEIGRGNLDYTIPVRSGDEIGHLAKAFNRMTKRLRESQQETGYRQQLLLTLSQVAQNIQRVRTPEAIYQAIGEGNAGLGFDAVVLRLSDDRTVLEPVYIGFVPEMLHLIEKLTGIKAADYRFDLETSSFFRQLIDRKEGLLVDDVRKRPTDILPMLPEPVARQILKALDFERIIFAPLAIEKETYGLLAVVGKGLTKVDLPAISTFADQAAIALENAYLHQEAREAATELERRVAERTRELRASEAELRSVYDSMNEGLALHQVVYDDSGKPVDYIILNINTAYTAILGLKKQDVVGRKATEVYDAEEAPYLDVYARVAETQVAHSFETHFPETDTHFFISVSSPARGMFTTIFRDITDRIKVAQALQESEERYRLLADNSTDMIALHEPDGKYRYVSPASRKLLGYEPEELIGQDAFSLCHQEDQERTRHESHDAVLDGRESARIEYRIRQKSGDYIWFETLTQPIVEDGEVVALLSSSRDVTDRKKAEAALRESEERFWTTSEQAEVGIAHVAPDGRYLAVNRRFAEITGRPQEDLLNTDYQTITHPDDLEADMEYVRQMLAGEIDAYSIEKRYVRKDGSASWVSLTVSLVHYASGEPNYFIAVVKDINDRVRMEQALAKSEAELRGIYNTMSEGLAVHRVIYNDDDQPSDYIILDVNPAFTDILNLERQDVVGRRATIAYGVAEAPYLDIYARVAETQKAEMFETYFSPMNKHFLISVTSPEKGMFTTIFKDISERIATARALQESEERYRQRAEDLARSNAELEQFAYVASHDLQEPLRMVSSYLQLLERRYDDQLDENAKEFIGYAVDGATRMKRLISDLLSFSRVNTRGKEPVLTDLNQVVDVVLKDLEVAVEETGTTITCDQMPHLKVDATKLAQVFQNLIGNSIKFRGDQSPQIHLGAERLDGEWRFCVQDNGIGIDPRYAERVFIIFQRLHTREEYSGTGMGLSICKKIVERHGGRIWVDSELGQGATVYFTLPNEEDEE